MEELLPLEKENRAGLLPENHYLAEDVLDSRIKLGIPEDGFPSRSEAVRWRVSHCKQHQCSKVIDRYGPDFKFPGARDDWNEIRHREFWSYEPSDVEIPLYRRSLDLVERYDLPDWAFFVLVWHLLTDEWSFPHRDGEVLPYPLPFGPTGYDRPVRIEHPSKTEIQIVVPIHEYITKDEWMMLWPEVDKTKEELKDITEVRPSSGKRGITDKSMDRVSKWLEWYKLKPQLGSVNKVVEFLYKMAIEGEGENAEEISAETIRYSINEIERMMKPRK